LNDQKKILDLLEGIKKKVENIEKKLEIDNAEPSKQKEKPATKKPSGNKKSLPVHIIELRDGGFFSQSKTAQETHAKLGVKYPCELNRVAVVLVRLAERRQLRKASKVINKKEYQAYVW